MARLMVLNRRLSTNSMDRARQCPFRQSVTSELFIAFAVVAMSSKLLPAQTQADAARLRKADTLSPTVREVPNGKVVKRTAAEQEQQLRETIDAIEKVVAIPESERKDNPQFASSPSTCCSDCMRFLPKPNAVTETLDVSHEKIENRSAISSAFCGSPPPNVFLNETLPPIDDPEISTAAMLIDAAHEVGKLDELAADLRPLVDRGVTGAQLLDNLAFLARDGSSTFRPRVDAALSEQQIDNQLNNAMRSANFTGVLGGYRAKALAAIDRTKGATLKPSPDPGLKHWMPVDLGGFNWKHVQFVVVVACGTG